VILLKNLKFFMKNHWFLPKNSLKLPKIPSRHLNKKVLVFRDRDFTKVTIPWSWFFQEKYQCRDPALFKSTNTVTGSWKYRYLKVWKKYLLFSSNILRNFQLFRNYTRNAEYARLNWICMNTIGFKQQGFSDFFRHKLDIAV